MTKETKSIKKYGPQRKTGYWVYTFLSNGTLERAVWRHGKKPSLKKTSK